MGVKVVDRRKAKKYNSHRRRDGSFRASVFVLLATVFALALLLSYLALFFNPMQHPFPMFFGLYFIPIALLNVLMLLWALLKRRMAVLIPVVALLPSLFLVDRFVRFGQEEPVTTGRQLKVLSYNLGRYDAGSQKVTQGESVAQVRRFLAEQNADVVCLQEFAVRDTNALGTCLPDYPYQARHLFKGERWFGNVTLSRYPIRESHALTFPQSRNLSLVTDIDVDGRTLRVYNCHLESYSISFTALVKRLFHKDSFTDEVVQVHERVREATRRRSEQVDMLLRSEAESPWPNLVCGDFNDTPISYTYHKLIQTKKDSFVEAGHGFSSTYSVLWPMLRVDYILLPQDWSATRHETFRIPWSDHYPVTTTIIINE